MDDQQLRVFLEVVRRGSFAAAGRMLDLDASVVTRGIAALEARLGVRLMHRSTRRLSLTDAGTVFYEHVSQAVSRLDTAIDEARAVTGQLEGAVRVTASVSFGQTMLLPLLPRLHARHPGLEVELHMTDAVLDLMAGQADIALRLGRPDDLSLIGLPLRPARQRVCASPDYLAAHGRPRLPADLANCACLRFPLPGYRTQWKFKKAGGEVEVVEIGGWLVLSTALALRQAALDGLGPVMLVDWLVNDAVAQGQLVDLFPECEVTATDFEDQLWLLYPSRAFVPRRVRAVVDFLREHLADGAADSSAAPPDTSRLS